MDYQSIYDTLMNAGQNAPLHVKKSALRTALTKLQSDNEPDMDVRIQAAASLAELDSPFAMDDTRIGQEMSAYANILEKKLSGAMEVEGGRRKRRRGKKTNKTKKQKRYTRRR